MSHSRDYSQLHLENVHKLEFWSNSVHNPDIRAQSVHITFFGIEL